MKKLNIEIQTTIIAGDRMDRYLKQRDKCKRGSARACRRMARMYARFKK